MSVFLSTLFVFLASYIIRLRSLDFLSLLNVQYKVERYTKSNRV